VATVSAMMLWAVFARSAPYSGSSTEPSERWIGRPAVRVQVSGLSDCPAASGNVTVTGVAVPAAPVVSVMVPA